MKQKLQQRFMDPAPDAAADGSLCVWWAGCGVYCDAPDS
jgi:hypothetical protein